jgi:predicted DNA binding CopG/RHH family protein
VKSRALHEAYTRQVNIRMTEDLLDRIDEHARRLSRPGLPVSRGDVVRIILEQTLRSRARS